MGDAAMTGTLYGLGVGPGDPELLTLKALRILKAADVVAYPAPETGDSFARSIVAAHLRPEAPEIAIRMPMVAARFPARAVYDQAAAEIGGHLGGGRDVAVLCEGDPFFYGSFMYLYGRLVGKHKIQVVPGVSSLTACAAALGAPLAARDDVLTVLPATLSEEELEDRLARTDCAAILKLGRHFAKVRDVLCRTGLDRFARYVERATLPDQSIRPLDEVDADVVPYFAMILLHRRGEAWA
jgi:precorrin-2/cobalt-factor-2 C20-methyltransferase